jgi:isopentenyldiphosphate isomerase
MNIKENFHIYIYKQQNKLIDEQRAHEDNHANILYDTALTFTDTSHPTLLQYKYNDISYPTHTWHTTGAFFYILGSI